jgi:hypothetical protein
MQKLTVEPSFMSGISVVENQLDLPKGLPPQLALSWNPDDLKQIALPQKNILIHFWEPSTAFRLALAEAKLAGTLPELRERFSLAGIQDFFQKDHGALLNTLFAELKPCVDALLYDGLGKQFQLTLARPSDQMCPLFHVDSVNLRLIVTLHGPGTEWLADSDVNRKQLGKGSNHKILRDGALIQQLKTFQVAFLKGEEYPGNYGKGLVHRSPALTSVDEARWIFRLDSFRMLRQR